MPETEKEFPKATKMVLESTYMDGSMDSAVNEEECIRLCRDLST